MYNSRRKAAAAGMRLCADLVRPAVHAHNNSTHQTQEQTQRRQGGSCRHACSKGPCACMAHTTLSRGAQAPTAMHHKTQRSLLSLSPVCVNNNTPAAHTRGGSTRKAWCGHHMGPHMGVSVTCCIVRVCEGVRLPRRRTAPQCMHGCELLHGSPLPQGSCKHTQGKW